MFPAPAKPISMPARLPGPRSRVVAVRGADPKGRCGRAEPAGTPTRVSWVRREALSFAVRADETLRSTKESTAAIASTPSATSARAVRRRSRPPIRPPMATLLSAHVRPPLTAHRRAPGSGHRWRSCPAASRTRDRTTTSPCTGTVPGAIRRGPGRRRPAERSGSPPIATVPRARGRCRAVAACPPDHRLRRRRVRRRRSASRTAGRAQRVFRAHPRSASPRRGAPPARPRGRQALNAPQYYASSRDLQKRPRLHAAPDARAACLPTLTRRRRHHRRPSASSV